jgi:hypothetical protein
MVHGIDFQSVPDTNSGGCDGVKAADLNWFKISEAGWDGKQWGSDLIHQTNRWSFNVPTGLASG